VPVTAPELDPADLDGPLLDELAVCGHRQGASPLPCGRFVTATTSGYRCPVREQGHAWTPIDLADRYVGDVVITRLNRSDAADLVPAGTPAAELWDRLSTPERRTVVDTLMRVHLTDASGVDAIAVLWRKL
jgi:hypothetical protein